MRLAVPTVVVLALALPQAALAFQVLGGHWPTDDGPVEYRVSDQGSDDIPDDSETAAVKGAFRSWECVLCSNVQFRYMGNGPNEMARDGVNSVFWLEEASLWQAQVGADIQSTLGVCQHFDLETYTESDIAFNGVTHHWSTDENASATDAESIAIHETGHFAGLDHACTDQSETNCLPATQAIMAPAYPGGTLREPFEDDRNGLCAVYPNAKAACEGKKRLKEACEKDCECEDTLFCVPDGTGARMCSRTCGAADSKQCPIGTGCTLGVNSVDGRGLCTRITSANHTKAEGMVCTRDSECATGLCDRASAVNRQVCTRRCQAAADCPDGMVCSDHTCLLPNAGSGVPCPDETPKSKFPFPLPPGCTGCNAAGMDVALWALLGVAFLRRKKNQDG